ncbi:MAG: RagB/SusD family nutrient uptake outer membrane protein [Bacteroides sp.]|nr:RagB/SusD family nutrient uptake outer membrane protein [Bacteroides sp.]
MKKHLIKGLAALMTAGVLTGCSSDYLDVAPVTTASAALVETTEEGAELAYYGICRSMYSQYSSFYNYMFFNGEPYVSMFYGELQGEDYFSYFMLSSIATNGTGENNRLQSGWVPTMAWNYCYNLINQANAILVNIDNIPGDEQNLMGIKAKCLTLRAHAYVRLLQIYAPRWEDSNEGEKMVAPLRVVPGTGDIPLSSMNDILARIYDDISEAEKLYTDYEVDRYFNWEPNIDVARGILVRAALIKHDWPTAQAKAKAARADYPIMTAEEYKGGFANANKEWMWNNAAESDGIYYAAHGSVYACNGPYPGVWNLGAGAINYQTYKKIPAGDVRADLFFTPDKLNSNLVRPAHFWNKNYITPGTMDLRTANQLMIGQVNLFCEEHYPTDTSVQWNPPYTNFQTGTNDGVYCGFGAQFKFWGMEDFGTNSFPFMRGAEMLLAEAEAAYYNGDETTAINNLLELNAQRNPNYTCNKTGEFLLNEIRIQRRIELWGEGHNWFDFKRWNLPINRTAWKEGDVNSNNVPEAYSKSLPASDPSWRYIVPNSETQYNMAIDRSLLD